MGGWTVFSASGIPTSETNRPHHYRQYDRPPMFDTVPSKGIGPGDANGVDVNLGSQVDHHPLRMP